MFGLVILGIPKRPIFMLFSFQKPASNTWARIAVFLIFMIKERAHFGLKLQPI
jgi:hypothetical protein